MQYMILIYGDESGFEKMSGNPDAMREMTAAWDIYTKALRDAGVYRQGAWLKPSSTATSVRVRNGKAFNTDGPFAETKEQLGGFYLIDAADLDGALAWAARCPGAHSGSVEVRPAMKVLEAV